jgi:hypothetical protein
VPRTLSTNLLFEKNRLESDHVWTWLFQLDIAGAPAPERLANYDQDVLFHGLFFERFRCEVDAIEDASSLELVHLRVTMTNVDQRLQSLLENYWAPSSDPSWAVTIWNIDASQPDEMPFEAGELFTVERVTTDFVVASLDLIAEGLTLGITLPKRRYVTSSGFPQIPRRV